MCSCDTSSGLTVSAQRQAAFSSCSRGAMALIEKALAEAGGRRRLLRLRPNGLRHLPAERTECSPQPEDQSITCARATATAPARPRPACTTSRKAPPPLPDSPRAEGRWRYTPNQSLRMRVPSRPCAASTYKRTGECQQRSCPKAVCHVLSAIVKAIALQPPSANRTNGRPSVFYILPLLL